MPKIHKIIKEIFNTEHGAHVNGDDGPALGAAFIAANYSAGIKTKKILMEDGPNYNVEFKIKKNDEILEEGELFKYKENIGTKR